MRGCPGATRSAASADQNLSVWHGRFQLIALLNRMFTDSLHLLIDFWCNTVYSNFEVIIMPTTKKRVNLALSEDVYERISAFMKKNGITSAAGACVMLIVQQLDAIDNNAKMMDFISQFPLEELQKLSNLGLAMVQQESQMQTD